MASQGHRRRPSNQRQHDPRSVRDESQPDERSDAAAILDSSNPEQHLASVPPTAGEPSAAGLVREGGEELMEEDAMLPGAEGSLGSTEVMKPGYGQALL